MEYVVTTVAKAGDAKLLEALWWSCRHCARSLSWYFNSSGEDNLCCDIDALPPGRTIVGGREYLEHDVKQLLPHVGSLPDIQPAQTQRKFFVRKFAKKSPSVRSAPPPSVHNTSKLGVSLSNDFIGYIRSLAFVKADYVCLQRLVHRGVFNQSYLEEVMTRSSYAI